MTTAPDKPDLAIIGGTGVYDWPGLEMETQSRPQTPWGETSDAIHVGRWHGRRLAFLARHGADHQIAPHEVNYRANLWALHATGARRVLGINAVGGIGTAFAPACLVLPDQLIDYTWGRPSTFHDGQGPVPHAEFAEPYSAGLRRSLVDAAASSGVVLIDHGCYGATQGPRLETCAEIRRMQRDGCDVVGMTGMPEAVLARELELDYCCLALVANWAAGCGDGGSITMQEVTANVHRAGTHLPALVADLK